MFITELENLATLRKIIFNELKAQTRSKFKDKRIVASIKLTEDKTTHQDVIFGTSIENSKKIYLEKSSPKIKIPKFLHLVVKNLEKKIQTEFLLRRGGSACRQKALKKEIETIIDLDNFNVHDVASLMKQWLRDLKEPLIPTYLHDLFLKCSHSSDPKKSLILACLLLPVDHLQTLRYLLCFLQKVAKQSQHNKMDVSNICIVMTPNIIPCLEKNSKLNKDFDKVLCERREILGILINEALKIGSIPENIAQKLNILESNCVKSSEDELERSCNSITTLSKSAKRRKRKSIVSELRKLVTTNVPLSNSRENLKKLNLTPCPKRKADADISSVSRKKPSTSSYQSTPKPSRRESYQFTPGQNRPSIQFTDTPVSEMCFSQSTTITPRCRRGSSRTGKSGCFRTPKSKSKTRSVSKDKNNAVAFRLAGEADALSVFHFDIKPSLLKSTDPVTVQTPYDLAEIERPVNEETDGPSPPKSARVTRSNSSKLNESSQKIGSIKRGRPNTIRSGLPSPFRSVQNFNSMLASEELDDSFHSDKGNHDEIFECDAMNYLNIQSNSNEERGAKNIEKAVEEVDLALSSVELQDKSDTGHKMCRKLRKSSSVTNLIQIKQNKFRKTSSHSEIFSHTGAKFAPLSKETRDILTNVDQMVEVDHKCIETTNNLDENGSQVWISGENFFLDKIKQISDSSLKRESVLRIERDNAGNVRANVNKFNNFQDETDPPKPEFKTPVGIVPRTPRRRSKRGQKTPVRIPSVFVRSSGVTNSIRSRYRSQNIDRRASLKVPPSLPLTTYVKHAQGNSITKRRHSLVYRSDLLKDVTKSPLKDSNIANMKI